MNENVWLISNRKKVKALLRQFEEHRMKGSYGGDINLGEAIMLTSGLINEIERLNRENVELKSKPEVDISKLKAKIETLEIENKHLKGKISTLKGE